MLKARGALPVRAEVARVSGRFDLIFADAQGGKWEGLDGTVAALRPGGLMLAHQDNGTGRITGLPACCRGA
jgi:predicted O-methyltransferase YrrM